MKDKLMQLLFGRILLGGLWISLIVTFCGGVFYMIKYGNTVIDYHLFHKKPSPNIWYTIIQTGIFILVLTQLLRVALVTWYYFKLGDRKFVGLSLFVLAVLVYSLFWAAL